ncbi:MAG: hypothetical protein ABSB28_03010 [Candidatus Bathyarchaeia archaeon]
MRERSAFVAACVVGLIVFIVGLYVFPGALVMTNSAGNTARMEGFFRVLDYNGTVRVIGSKAFYGEPFSTEETSDLTYNGSSRATKTYAFNVSDRAESLRVGVYFGEGTLFGWVTQDYRINLTLSFENKTIFFADNTGQLPFTIGPGMGFWSEGSCVIDLNSSRLFANDSSWVYPLRTIPPGFVDGTFVDKSTKLAPGNYLFSVRFSSQDTISGIIPPGMTSTFTSIYDVRTEISTNETAVTEALNVATVALPGISIAGAGLTYLLMKVVEKRAKLKSTVLSVTRNNSE